MKNILFILLYLGFSLTGLAQQQLRFQNFDTRDGLSHYHVNWLLKDSRGFLWVGTEFGLNRFDGVAFEKWFHIPKDTTSLLNNKILNMAEDQQQRIWVATEKGISIYSIHTGKFSSYRNIVTQNAGTIPLQQPGVFCDKDGDLWIGNAGGSVILYRSATHSFLNIPLQLSPPERMQNNYVAGFLQDQKNRIWVGTSYGVYRIDKAGLKATAYRIDETNKYGPLMNSCIGLFETQQGHVLCGTWNAGYLIFDEKNDLFSPAYSMEGPFLPSNVVFNFGQDRNTIFFATIGGLFTCGENNLLSSGFSGYRSIKSDPKDPFSIASTSVTSIVTDSSGSVWIGGDHGLSLLSSNTTHFKSFSYTAFTKNQQALPIDIEHDGKHLLVALSNEVLVFDLEKEMFVKNQPEIKKNGMHRFIKSGNHFYQPSRATLYVYDENFKLVQTVYEKHPQGWNMNIFNALEDKEGNVWTVTSRYGIRKHDNNSKVTSFLNDSTQTVHSVGDILFAIVESNTGAIYAGGKELFVLKKSSDAFTSISILDENQRNDIRALKMKGDMLWIGSHNGLYSYEENTGKITPHILPAEINQVIEELEVDLLGNIWMVTSSGLIKYNPADSTTMVFNDKTGWPRTLSSIKTLTDGRIVAGSSGEITIIDPAAIKPEMYSPQPYITAIIIDEEKSFLMPERDTTYCLKYNQSIRFNYISLTYLNAANNKYAWQLKGLDDRWHDAGNLTSQPFASLTPGKYSFSIKSANANSIWSESISTINFKVMPPFYRTTWFITLMTLTIAGIIYLFYRYRLQKAIEVERMRTRIATDLHDDIGATLSSISFYSEAVYQKTKNKMPEVSPILEKMGETSRTMVSSMSDIVWAINPMHDDMGKMLDRMQSYARELCALRGIELRISINDQVRTLKPHLEMRRNIYLIFKEALNNALKYSDGKVIRLSAELNGNIFHLGLADDGKGFNSLMEVDGNGIKNMQKRAEEIGGHLTINSIIGSGTEVYLTVTI